MKYIIFKDFSEKETPILFPSRILHREMRDQIPYGDVISAGFVFLEPSGFVCKGESKDLKVKARAKDAQIIENYFLLTAD